MEEWRHTFGAIVNADDVLDNFWGHNYLVTLSEFGPTLLVNAAHEQDALDSAIDYAEEQGWVGLFLDPDDIDELLTDAVRDGHAGYDAWTYLDEYPSGGNHGLYLSSRNVSIREVKNGISQ